MSLKPTHPSGVKDQRVGDYTDAVTRGGSGVEEGTCQDEDEVIGVSQEDSGRDLGLVKGDDGNRGRGLDLMSEEPQQIEDASILTGESQSPIELEPTNMVYTPHLFAGLSPDGCPLQQLEETTMEETVGNEHIEQADKDEHTEQLMGGGVGSQKMGGQQMGVGQQQMGVPMTFGEPMPGGQPGTREKEVIWKGELEWQERLKKGPADLKIPHSVNCTVSTSKENGVPEVKPDNWPAKLIMQLIPKSLVQTIGGQYFRNSKSVLFHPNECESLDVLTKVMGTGFAGCVHFTGVQACDIKVLILLYSNDKKAFLGFIPNDQVSFVDRIRTVIQQVRAQGFLQQLEQTGNDETVGNEHIEQADKDETVGNDLPPVRKGISAKHLPQELSVFDSQDWSVLLPDEVVLILFKFMKPGDILKASQTCQLWRNLGENDKLWQQKCKEAGLVYSLTAANLTGLERRNKNSIIAHSAWKENFLKPYKLARKLREGVLEVLTIESLNKELSHGEPEMELFNDKIVSSRDNNLYVFCASSGKLLHELVGHTSDVETIQMNDLFIVSGSHDGSVKVWNVDTGSCLHTLVGARRKYNVPLLQMHGTILVTYNLGWSQEGIRVWDVRKGRCLKILTVYTWVRHVQFDGRLVVSGHDRYIKIWDPETGVCLRTFSKHSSIITMKFNGVVVVAGYSDGSIKVWEVNTGICRLILVENYFGDRIELQGDMMVCRGADRKTPKIWNMFTGACLNTLGASNKHKQHISDIEVNDRFVVTSSRDGTVKLWDIKTGEFIRNLFVLESDGFMEKMRMKDGKIVCFVFAHKRSKFIVLNFDTNESD